MYYVILPTAKLKKKLKRLCQYSLDHKYILNIFTSPISNFFYLFLFNLSKCKFFY